MLLLLFLIIITSIKAITITTSIKQTITTQVMNYEIHCRLKVYIVMPSSLFILSHPIYIVFTSFSVYQSVESLIVFVSKSGDRSVVQSVRHSSVLFLRQPVGPAISYEIWCSLENITGIETSFLNKKCWELTQGCKDKKNRIQQRSEVI